MRSRPGFSGSRRRRGGLRAACAALLLVLAGCVSEAREQQIGDQMAAEVNSQIPLVRDPLLNAYVTSLGRLLASASDRPKLQYQFYIINSGAVNAFALPGGYIYVTRGLLERTESGAELAAVLAHEIGHVAERHGVEKLQRHLRTGSLVSLLYSLFLGGEPAILQQNATRLAGMLWSASHSREDEEQADRLAVEYLIETGFNPNAMLALLESLLEDEQQDPGPLAGWFSTHPMTTARIEVTRDKIREEVGDAPPAARVQLTSYPAFLARLSLLPPPPDAP